MKAVFSWAIDHELRAGDAVHILHVIVGAADRDLRLDYFDQREEGAVLAAQQPMIDRRFVSQLRARGLALPVTIHLIQARRAARSGSAASEDATTLGRIVCRHAESSGAALVVMGRPDHSRLHDLLFGSAADYVSKHCSRPVRVLRPADLQGGAAGAAAHDGLGV